MPDYLYSDGRHLQTVTHRMAENPLVLCAVCGAVMHRRPQAVSVVWGGNPPSKGGLHPLVEELNRTYDRRVDEFAAKKEAHVNRTRDGNTND